MQALPGTGFGVVGLDDTDLPEVVLHRAGHLRESHPLGACCAAVRPFQQAVDQPEGRYVGEHDQGEVPALVQGRYQEDASSDRRGGHCLKRYIARQVHRQLENPPATLDVA